MSAAPTDAVEALRGENKTLRRKLAEFGVTLIDNVDEHIAALAAMPATVSQETFNELYAALEALLFRCELYLGKSTAGYTDDAIMIAAGKALAKARGEQVLGARVEVGATRDAPNSTEGKA